MSRSVPLSAVLFLCLVAVAGSVLPAVAAPVLTSVTPPYAVNTTYTPLIVWGSGFLGSPGNYHASNPSMTLRRAGQSDITIPGSSVYLFPAGNEIGTNVFPITGAALGAWDVVVTNNDGTSATLPGAFTVLGPYATPTVTGVTPDTAPNDGSLLVTVTGTNFFVPPAVGGPLMTVKLGHGTPYGSITATEVNVLSPTQLNCTFDLTSVGWGASSPWDVIVQAPSTGPSGTLSNAFTVTAPAPTLTAITPNYGPKTNGISAVITGTNFLGTIGYNAGNPLVTLRQAGQTDITIARGSVYKNNSGQITGTLPLTNAPLGVWDVIVTNYDGQFATIPGGFTVYATARPTVTAITPASGGGSGSVSITNLAGTGFLAGSTVKLVAAGQPDIAGTSVALVGTTKITCNFDLTGAAAGVRDVVVTLLDGQFGTKVGAFTIFNPAPVVTSLSPNSGPNNVSTGTTITGSGFLSGATVKLSKTGQTDIVATGVNVISPTQISCTFSPATAATGVSGGWDVVVTNPSGLPGTLAAGFTVTYPAPTVTSITPPYAVNSSAAAIQVWGTGFQGKPGAYDATNPRITLRKAGQTDITASGASIFLFAGGNEISINNFPISGAAVGAWDVIVTNADGQSATLPGAFTVLAPHSTPTVTGITPDTAPNSGPASVTITGTNFFVPPAPGGPVMAVTLGHGTPFGNLAATNVVVTSPTQLTCTFNLTDVGWGTGSPWNLTVQAPSSGPSGTLNNAFTVTASAPTITAITPPYGAKTGGASVVVTGTNFLGTVGYSLGNPSITLRKAGQADITLARGSVYRTNSGQISGSLPITNAPLGAWDVIVTNYDGQSATLPGGFTIYATARPTVTAITPTTGANTGSVSVTNLAGTGFLAGAVVKLAAAGLPDIIGTSVALVGTTKITCNFDLTGAPGGARDVIVTLPDGQFGTKIGAFTISSVAPTVASISPNSGLNDGSVSITNVSGTGFATGATLKLRMAGQTDLTATGVSVVTSSQITGTVDLTGAATGVWDVVVTNTDALSGTLAGGFTVTSPPPTLTSATYIDGTHVDLLFNEALDLTTAESAGNYAVSPALTVTGAVLDANTMTVHLTTDPQADHTTYTATVTGVKDSLGTTIANVSNTAQWTSADLAPTVTGVNYLNSSHVDVLFSKALDSTTAQTITNYVVSPAMNVYTAVLDPNGSTVHLTTALMPGGATYALTVTGVQSLLGTVVSATANTGSWTSGVAPTVTSQLPTGTGVAASTKIKVVFSQSMLRASVQGAFSTTPATTGTFTWSGKTVYYAPTGGWAGGTTYTVTIGTAARTTLGVRLAAPFSWDFTTAPVPTVTASSPNGTGVARTPQFRVVFSETMQRSSCVAAFSTSPASTGVFSWTGKTMYYTPSAPLAANTPYTVTVDTGAKTMLGMALAAPYSWSFTTGARMPAQIVAAAVPTAAGAQITVNLTTAATVDVRIVNLAGRQVATLAPQDLPEGVSTLLWSGKSTGGTATPAGLYFLQISARTDDGNSSSCVIPLQR